MGWRVLFLDLQLRAIKVKVLGNYEELKWGLRMTRATSLFSLYVLSSFRFWCVILILFSSFWTWCMRGTNSSFCSLEFLEIQYNTVAVQYISCWKQKWDHVSVYHVLQTRERESALKSDSLKLWWSGWCIFIRVLYCITAWWNLNGLYTCSIFLNQI